MKVNVHDPRGGKNAPGTPRATAALAQVPSPRVDAELLAAHLLYDGYAHAYSARGAHGGRLPRPSRRVRRRWSPAAHPANRCSTSPAPPLLPP